MYSSVNILRNMVSFDKSEQFDGFSKVRVIVSDEIEYSAGTDTGRTLTLNCPWGNQEIANNILQSIKGFRYQPMTATDALIDPSVEIGDGIRANGVYSGVYALDTKYNSNLPATASAPADEELYEEHTYTPKAEREVTRKFLNVQSQLKIQDGKISTEVKERKDDVNGVKSLLEQHGDQIVAKVDKVQEHTSTTFGWSLGADSWRIFSGTSTVLKATKDGLEVKGKITATSGTIGGFTINDKYISYNNQIWGGTNTKGAYIGQSGIQLGRNFKVDMQGNLTASSGKMGNWDINSSGLSYNGQTWGGTNTTGAYIGKSGIQLGKNFKVDMQGNITAKSGTFSGNVNAGNIQYGGDAGYFSGGGLSDYSIGGLKVAGSTLGTRVMSGGINTSLGYADYANGIFNGWNQSPYLYVGYLNVVNSMFYGQYRVSPKSYSFKDSDGNQVTLYYMAWGKA